MKHTMYIANNTKRKNRTISTHIGKISFKNRNPHTLAEDPASAKDPLKPFFLTNPAPETDRHKIKQNISV